jgi:hypothetical protein
MESSGTPLEACLAGAAGACAMSETITQFYYIDNIEALMALETVCTDGGGIWISSPE